MTASVSFYDSTPTSITFKVDYFSYANEKIAYDFYFDGSNEGSRGWYEQGSSYNLHTFSGLEPNTPHTFSIQGQVWQINPLNFLRGFSDSATGATEDITPTTPNTPTLHNATYSNSEIILNCSRDSNTDYIYAYASDAQDGTYNYIGRINIGGGTTDVTVSFHYPMAEGETKYFKVKAYNDSGSGAYSSYSNSRSEYVPIPNVRPSNWNWTTNVQSGEDLTEVIIDGVKYAYVLTALEWNDFVDRINAFRIYKELDTTAIVKVNQNENMYASYINLSIDAINEMLSVDYITHVVSGGTNIASKLIEMKDKLNSIQ